METPPSHLCFVCKEELESAEYINVRFAFHLFYDDKVYYNIHFKCFKEIAGEEYTKYFDFKKDKALEPYKDQDYRKMLYEDEK